ncbi:hypothetical protein NDU88_003085 [Pleurodeles waltl]|uniref:Uncharacterized protein n=1 Tax=Pleurodeles waltl TaxID=8319 RepID=A0AAV7P8W3_PLEWA|nr:hypothetical protein NDU88_003085 [Pleurodeles waltl]
MLFTSGAGLVAPPAERAPLILVSARLGRRRRAARSLWDPGAPAPGVRPLLSSLHQAALPRATSFLIRSTGTPRSGPRDLAHPLVCRPQILVVSASLLPRVAANSHGFSRRAEGGRHPSPRPPQPQEIRPSPKRRAASLRGAVRCPGPPLF